MLGTSCVTASPGPGTRPFVCSQRAEEADKGQGLGEGHAAPLCPGLFSTVTHVPSFLSKTALTAGL